MRIYTNVRTFVIDSREKEKKLYAFERDATRMGLDILENFPFQKVDSPNEMEERYRQDVAVCNPSDWKKFKTELLSVIEDSRIDSKVKEILKEFESKNNPLLCLLKNT